MVRKSVKSGSLRWCFTCFTLHNFYYGVLPAFHSTSVLSSLMSKGFIVHMEARIYAYVFAVSPVIFLLPLSGNFPFKGQHL